MSRKLDVAIAEALGYTVIMLGNHYFAVKNMQESVIKNLLPYYSSDGNAMLKLDAEVRKRGRGVRINIKYDCRWWEADYFFIDRPMGRGRSESEPLARALAVYHALTGKRWRNE